MYKSDFFPSRGKYFTVITDDNEKIILNRGQKDDGSALETPENNTILGLYLRKRLGVPENERITKESIVNYGRDYITIRKRSDTEFYLDFSVGSIF